MVGIAGAFLGAGARSVIVALWAIDDKATKEFMKHFFKHLSEGQCVSKCLHKAMKHLRESDDFNDVRYWAPFVLIGDDVTINFNEIRWGSCLKIIFETLPLTELIALVVSQRRNCLNGVP